MKKIRYEYKITFVYLIFGIIWIIFSDKIIVAISNPSNVNLFHSIKGSIFVVFGSILIFSLLKTHLQKLRQTERNLHQQNQVYEALNEEYKTVNSELLNAKEKAEENEEKFRTIFDTCPDGIALTNIKGEIIEVNQTYLQLLGLTKEETININFEEITPTKWHKFEKEKIEYQIKTGKPLYFEKEFIKKDGTVFPVALTGWNIKDEYNTTKYVGAFIKDITESVKTQQTLKKLQIAIESSKASIVITDFDGNIEYANPFFTESTDYSIDEYLGKNPRILKTDLRDQTYYKTLWNTIKSGQTWEGEFCNRKKNGEIYWENSIISPVKNEKGDITHFVAVKTDITERKKIEIELIRSQEHFKGIFEQAAAGIAAALPTGKFVNSNLKFAEMLGYSIDELLKLSAYDVTFPTDMEHEKKLIRQILDRNSNTFTIEKRYIHKNGHLVWANLSSNAVRDENGKIKFVIGVIVDISERKNIEIELIKAKEKTEVSDKYFRSIFEQSPIMFWEQDYSSVKQYLDYLKENGINDFIEYFKNKPNELFVCLKKIKIINVNNSAVATLQFPDKQTLLQNLSKTFTSNTINTFSLILASVANSNMYCEHISDCKANSGEIKHFYFKLFIPLEFKKSFSRVIAAMIDITALKNTEQELILAKEKAEESDKLKTAFLNNISHEIRTPLNAISGFSQIITEPNQSPDKLAKFSEIINTSSEKLIEIITDVIEVSQLHSRQLTISNCQFDFISLTNEIIIKYSNQIKSKGIDFIVIINPNLKKFEIISDKNKLCLIIKHLIDNAIKFTHKGSIILDFSLSNEIIEFKITDTGIGISKEMHEIIFEPFRQVEIGSSRNYGGNGIGLALAKGFVELLNGTIKLQSEFNIGTTLNVTIPVQKVSNDDELKMTELKVAKKANTFLIVEDEYSNYLFLAELLEEFCTTILYASNGQHAIEICRTEKKIDLVLMDIKMPIMDGHTATKLIKAFRPDLPIIAQSAYALDSDKEKFLESGFDDYITKPIQSKILYETINKNVAKI